jgi:hypothetical protein
MRIEGLRIAKITAKHSPAVQVIESHKLWCPDVAWSMQIALFSIKLFGPQENIGLSVRLGKKKSGFRPGGIRADVGDGMRIRGVGCAIRWD